MKKSLLLLCLGFILSFSAFAQVSEIDTLGYYKYTATFNGANYVKESDTSGYWTFTFKSAEGNLFTFETYTESFMYTFLANHGNNGSNDYAVNTGKSFIVYYYELEEYVWYDDWAYYDGFYEADDVFKYNIAVSAEEAP